MLSGHLGPAHRIGHEHQPVRLLAVAHDPVHPDAQLHVLADRLVLQAAGVEHLLPAVEPERARDDQERAHRRVRDAAGEERAQVLDHLEARHPVARHAHLGDPPAFDLAAVDDADDAADAERVGRLEERQHRLAQRVGLEERIGVDEADERIARRVDAGVERVGAAAVLLVDHHELGVRQRAVDGADLGRLDHRPDRHRRLDQIERLRGPLQRLVLRSVVDADHLELRVVEQQERAHALDDGRLLVVGGRDHADAGRRRRLHDRFELARRPAVAMLAELEERQHRAHQVRGVDGEEIEQHELLEDEQQRDEGAPHAGPPPSGRDAALPQHLPGQDAGQAGRVLAGRQLALAGRAEHAQRGRGVRGDEPFVAEVLRQVGRGVAAPRAAEGPRRHRPHRLAGVAERAQHVVVGAIVEARASRAPAATPPAPWRRRGSTTPADRRRRWPRR